MDNAQIVKGVTFIPHGRNAFILTYLQLNYLKFGL